MIVDASVAIKWLFDEPESDVARRIAKRSDLVAPDIIVFEIANAVWKKVRRGELRGAPGRLAETLNLFDHIESTAPLIAHATAIAIALDHPAYDCFYLALSELLDRQLVTADTRMLAKLSGTEWAGRALSLTQWAAIQEIANQ